MVLLHVLVHGVELAHAGQLNGEDPLLLVAVVLPVVLHEARLRHVVDDGFDLVLGHAAGLREGRQGHRHADFHAADDLLHVVRDPAIEAPVLGVGRADGVADAVGHALGEAELGPVGRSLGGGREGRLGVGLHMFQVDAGLCLGAVRGVGSPEVGHLPELGVVGLLRARRPGGLVEDRDRLRAVVAGRADAGVDVLPVAVRGHGVAGQPGGVELRGRLQIVIHSALLATIDNRNQYTGGLPGRDASSGRRFHLFGGHDG